MGKNFCKVEWKWCKHLKHNGVCSYCNSEAAGLSVCPRIKEIETTRFYEIMISVDFEGVFAAICKFYPNEVRNRNGYEEVFNKLRSMTPKHHKLTDFFLEVTKFKEGDEDWVSVSGIDRFKVETRYGMEFTPWNDLISMYLTQETLDNLSHEEIVGACLYEITFFGFDEETVGNQLDEMNKSVEKAIKELRERN